MKEFPITFGFCGSTIQGFACLTSEAEEILSKGESVISVGFMKKEGKKNELVRLSIIDCKNVPKNNFLRKIR